MTVTPGGRPDTASALSLLARWYRKHQRDLPWRSDPQPWHVLVSEVMLQQTPVARVTPVYSAWVRRWASPGALAEASTADAIRMWGRLGYPRRATRLHAAAVACTTRHGGKVPARYEQLLALPGVGSYTAAAVAVFAFGQRHAVLDTNVRRVQWRWLDGHEHPPTASPTRAEESRALNLLPAEDARAAETSIALMELGALVCRAKDPRCSHCPLRSTCRWLGQGRPPALPRRRLQVYQGTDRQCRGALLQVVRESHASVRASELAEVWPLDEQRSRCLDSLIADGLLRRDIESGETAFGLPTE